MKITVRIDDGTYEVDVADLRARPIIALVEGERFEVWPEEGPTAAISQPLKGTRPLAAPRAANRAVMPAAPTAPAARNDAKAVHAPIPGVIISVAVKPGDQVEVGQELCVLEAMKMKNSIRAPRAGQIGAVPVSVGQHVQHHDLLFEYAD